MKIPIKKISSSGFTLVETLVYLFIFILISSGAIGLLFSLNDLFVQYKLKQALLASGTTAMERILMEIREADSVIVSDSVFASSTAGVLVLDKGVDTIKIDTEAGDLGLYKNNLLEGVLHSDEIDVVGTTYYYYDQDGIILIRVKLDLSSTAGLQTEDWSLTGGAIIRSSYEAN